MAIASLVNVEKHFGKKVLFEKLDLAIYEGERVGFIGPNGSGKTTLFRMLTGQEKPDFGTVSVGRNTKVGYLVQNPVFDAQSTVVDEAELGFADLHRLSHQMRDLEHKMAETTGDELEKVLEKYQNVQHDFDLAGGYAWQHKMEATLLGVGLGRETWEQKISELSGGQRRAWPSPSSSFPNPISFSWTNPPTTSTSPLSSGSKNILPTSTAPSSSSPTTASSSIASPRASSGSTVPRSTAIPATIPRMSSNASSTNFRRPAPAKSSRRTSPSSRSSSAASRPASAPRKPKAAKPASTASSKAMK